MNNEQQTWILRKPIIGKKYVNGKANFPEGVWSRFIETKSGMATMSEEVFHETFVEFDLEHLRQQAEDLARPLFVGGREGSTRWVDEDGLNKFVDRILDVTLGRKQ